jgi:hypothetical protein
MPRSVSSTLSRAEEHRACEELVNRGYAVRLGPDAIDLTPDGRDWLLLAVWMRLGAPGFEPEWWR